MSQELNTSETTYTFGTTLRSETLISRQSVKMSPMKTYQITINKEAKFKNLITLINEHCENSQFELYPLKIKWYNSYIIHENFKLDYNENTLAFVIINKPSLFDTIINHFKQHPESVPSSDPIDTFSHGMIINFIEEIKVKLCTFLDMNDLDYTILHDENIHPLTKIPHVQCQTAGHAAGATFYYLCQNEDEEDRVDHCEKVGCCGEIKEGIDVSQYFLPGIKPKRGVSIHHQFGGWFSFSGVVILSTIKIDSENKFFQKKLPINPFENNNTQQLLCIHLYMRHWYDDRYRNLINPKYKYSKEAQIFFSSPASQRSQVLKDLLQK